MAGDANVAEVEAAACVGVGGSVTALGDEEEHAEETRSKTSFRTSMFYARGGRVLPLSI
jgi:hypothetical protein